MKGLTLNQSASTTRTFSSEEVAVYRALTGDEGLHFGAAAATAVPGPLLAGLISDLLGTRLPGRGTNWLKQQLSYPAVAQVGEEITAVVTITRLRPDKELVNLRTTCANLAGALVCTGEALVYVKNLEISESKS